MMDNDQMNLDSFIVSKDKSLIQIDRVLKMLAKTYWAKDRPREVVEKAIENSCCYCLYIDNVQVGFARVVSDYATAYYICDVVVDEAYRGKGVGKKLIATIMEDDTIKSLFAILATRDAHGFYEKLGFVKDGNVFMFKR